MDLQPLREALQGALWRKDRRFILLVTSCRVSGHVVGHPRIKMTQRVPDAQDPFLQKVAIVIFCRPHNLQEANELARHLATTASNRPRTFFWDRIFAAIEDEVLDRLAMNLLPDETLPPEVKPLQKERPKNGKLFARGELTAFIRANAQPGAYGPADDIRRLYAMIAEKPGAPSLKSFSVSYYALFPAKARARSA